MNQRFKEQFAEKVKDFGLSSKAVEELMNLANLADDASDEEAAAKVDLLVPFAKAMQGEITRKTRKPIQTKESTKEADAEKEIEEKKDEMPDWAKSLMAEVGTLKQENEALRAERAKSERASQIVMKAKALNIPDYLMKRVSFADDADIDKELADYKQELVTNGLMPKDVATVNASEEEQFKADAKAWAMALPDAN